MFYQRFTFRLFFQIIVLNLLIGVLIYLVWKTNYWITIAAMGLITLFSIYRLIRFIDLINSDINRFIAAVKTRDHTLNFQNKSTKGSFPQLYDSFNDILATHRSIQLEQEGLFQLLKTILEQVATGIIVLKNAEEKKTEIVFFNHSAQKMLRIPAYRYWSRVKQHLPQLDLLVMQLKDGGRHFLELDINGRQIQLALSVTPLRLKDHLYSIITFQNIKDEIEQKEIEAWNKLIQVISHELLNSITPISSLSATLQQLVSSKENIDEDTMNDIQLAVDTIHKRSVGLMEFVKDYRLMTELTTPVLQPYAIGELLAHINRLMQPLVSSRSVRLEVMQTLSKTTFPIDLKLIEQVLINLITNSLYALDGVGDPYIRISYQLEEGKLILTVEDNGKGIPEENREKIFIPFFTTRPGGSGIGLTISRNIMKLHKGNILIGESKSSGTEIKLIFPYSSN